LSPRIRPDVVSGKTYKVKTGYGALFVTVNDDESGAPLEVFATLGKSGGFFQEQSEALCRLISTALRSRIKAEEIIKQLKGIRGPMPVMTNRGTILSLPDAIAQILEAHVTGDAKPADAEMPELVSAPVANAQSSVVKEKVEEKKSIANYGMMPGCPECGGNLILKEGCMACSNCGFSRCG
jgi:ribonucleoside-diphosphate reductase alpha chain